MATRAYCGTKELTEKEKKQGFVHGSEKQCKKKGQIRLWGKKKTGQPGGPMKEDVKKKVKKAVKKVEEIQKDVKKVEDILDDIEDSDKEPELDSLDSEEEAELKEANKEYENIISQERERKNYPKTKKPKSKSNKVLSESQEDQKKNLRYFKEEIKNIRKINGYVDPDKGDLDDLKKAEKEAEYWLKVLLKDKTGESKNKLLKKISDLDYGV